MGERIVNVNIYIYRVIDKKNKSCGVFDMPEVIRGVAELA